MFDNLFNKAQPTQGETKSVTVSQLLDIIDIPTYSFGQTGLAKFLTDFVTSPIVYTAVTKITQNFSPIDPRVFDKKNKQFLPTHPLTDLINKRANPFQYPALFKDELSSFYLLTGNVYIDVMSKLSDVRGQQPVIELRILNPKEIQPVSTGTTGFVTSYIYNAADISVTYHYDIIAQKYLNGNGSELLHLKSFNPKSSSTNFLGISALEPLILEIEQYLQASIHNLSVLKNQGRPSAIVTTDKEEGGGLSLTNEQISEVKKRFTEIKGSENAGKINFLPFNLKWQAISESIKDMDFKTLKTMTEEAVYKAFSIPLTFASNDAGTFNNKASDKLTLFDDAVIPLTKRIYSFVGTKLLPRYPNSDNLELKVDQSEIPVLARRQIAVTKEKAELGALSTNEIRTEIGKETIGKEGDIIYQPANLVPLGTDKLTSDNRDKPARRKADDLLKEKAYFRKMLCEQGYGKEYIDKCLKEQYA